MDKYRVWWIPQVPGQCFTVEVSSIQEGVKMMDVLGDYDRFQFEQKVKPDYCNAGGLQVLDPDDDYEPWPDWFDPDTGEDDPRVFLEMHEQDLEGK